MRVLVTGGAGFIGSHIAQMVFNQGHFVGIIDDLSSGRIENIDPSLFDFQPSREQGSRYFEKGDIVYNSANRVSVTQMRDVCSRWEIDTICHLAAQPSLRKSIDDPVFDAQVNIIGTLNVIRIAKEIGAHLVFASTSAVYDPNGELPYRESDCVKPHLPYGIAKATAERYIQDSGISYTILRYGNVYGPRQVEVGENQLIPHCLNYLLHNKHFTINGDGFQTRDFVYVEDIARANLMAMEKRPQGIFNCGSGLSTSINKICEHIYHIGFNADNYLVYPFQHGPAKEGEVKHSLLDSSKAFESFGWKSEISLQDGLRKTYEWAKAQ